MASGRHVKPSHSATQAAHAAPHPATNRELSHLAATRHIAAHPNANQDNSSALPKNGGRPSHSVREKM